MLLQTHNTKKAPPKAKNTTTKSNSSSRNGKGTKKATQSWKWAALESKSEAKTQSEDEPIVKTPSRKKAQVAKRNNESDEDVEEVDGVNPSPPVKDISDDEGANSANEIEVSKKKESLWAKTHKSPRGMALTSINMAPSLKKNLSKRIQLLISSL